MFRVRRTPAAERHDTPQAEKYYSTPSTTPGDKMEHSLKKLSFLKEIMWLTVLTKYSVI